MELGLWLIIILHSRFAKENTSLNFVIHQYNDTYKTTPLGNILDKNEMYQQISKLKGKLFLTKRPWSCPLQLKYKTFRCKIGYFETYFTLIRPI